MRACSSASSIVCPSTKCEARSRIACRVAARTAGMPRRLMRLSRIVSGVSPGWMMRAVTPSVQAEADTSIAHAQQRLRQHHEGEALLGGQRIGVQEILDAAESPGPGPDPLDETPCIRVDSPFGVADAGGLTEQSGRDRLVGRRIGSAEEGCCVCIRGQGYRRIWDHDRSALDWLRLGPAALILTAVHAIGLKNNSHAGTKWQGAVFEICEGRARTVISPCALHAHVLYLAASAAVHGGAARGPT